MKKLIIFTILSLVLASCAPTGQLTSQTATTPNTVPVTGQTATPSAGTAVPSGSTSNSPSASGTAPSGGPTAPKGMPNFQHIILIMLENKDYSSVIGNSQMPMINALATNNVLLSNYFAVSHPSLPNYIALMSGSTQGITSDCTNCFVNQPNLADEIKASGRTWKAYLESMPSPCFIGDSGNYAQKHNPLLYFDSVRLNTALCASSIQPLTSLDSDLANKTLPNFLFIMPNLCDSGHNCSASVADKWTGDMVAKLQASPALGNNSLIIIAFDEGSESSKSGCCGLSTPAGGQVAVVLISPTALPDMTDNTPYDHYSLLKTILTSWNLPLLGTTANAETKAIMAPWVGLANQSNSNNTASVPAPTKTINDAVLTGVQSAGCTTSSPVSAAYTVKLCFTSPESGSSLSGNASVTASIEVTGKNPGVKRMKFNLGKKYLLTDFTNPYTFSLPTNKWADGTYTLYVTVLMQDGFTSAQAEIPVSFSNGNVKAPVNTVSFTPSTGTTPASGQPFVVAAAGDGAGGEKTADTVVNLVKSLNPNLFLYLGDVYESGSVTEFYNWYGDGSNYFSSLRAITDPTIGNHEYGAGPSAPGYFDYWNNIPNYYSFNAGGWHFISLNANSARIDVSPTGSEYQWLQQDLASNTSPCTIAFYHEPLFNIGAEGPAPSLASIWALLAQNGVSIVLNGHDHDYQRWVPLDGNGQPSPNGITEFVAGGGGHGIQKLSKYDSRVAYSNAIAPTTFGVLLLKLGQSSANFTYQSVNGSVLDTGTITCKGTSTK